MDPKFDEKIKEIKNNIQRNTGRYISFPEATKIFIEDYEHTQSEMKQLKKLINQNRRPLDLFDLEK